MKSAKNQLGLEGLSSGGEVMANRRQSHMWWTIAVMLIILWLPGLLVGYTAGGVISILLLLALAVLLFRIMRGRRPA